MSGNRFRSWLAMVWELPLALASFLLFCLLSFLLKQILKHQKPARVRGGPKWGLLDTDTVSKRLWAIMLIGPRWNTHATIAGTGVIRIERSLTIDVVTATRSAEQWSAVLCRPDGSVAATVGSNEPLDGERYRVLQVAPGNYTFAMRYYGARPDGLLPELRLDDNVVVPALAVPPSSLDVYRNVRGKRGLFYAALAWYIYPLLRSRRWLPAAFVKAQFLPAGNPGTDYAFDAVEPRQRLRIEVPPSCLAHYRVMFTAYDRASFPTLWGSITASSTETEPMPAQGFWLLRLHPLSAAAPRLDPAEIVVTTL